MGNKLTEKQKRFVREYLIDFNATEAAIKAGYSEKTARKIGSENLTKPDIQKEIQRRYHQEEQILEEEYNVTKKWIRERLLAVADGDIKNYASWTDDEVKLIHSDDLDNARAIKRLKTKKRIEHTRDGDPIITVEKDIVLKDDIKALELLGKSIGMFQEIDDDERKQSGIKSLRERVLQLAKQYSEESGLSGSDSD